MELEYKNHLILDQISSWSCEIVEIIERSKVTLQKYLDKEKHIDYLAEENVDYRVIRPMNEYKELWESILLQIESELDNNNVVGFHCTRLLDNEISEILLNGLLPLDINHAKLRIENLFKTGLISNQLKDSLINKDELIAKNRKGRTFFFHFKSRVNDERGVFRLFNSWGGESMYINHENKTELQMIGTPCIVVASMERSKIEKEGLTRLSERMISIYLNDEYYLEDFITCLSTKTKVLEIIRYENPRFKVLTNIENWRNEIFIKN